MSLHNLASHIQSHGRGEDKMLVHMTPGEVQGLQALAMKHGGSLTINPETGLPEAKFLDKILPVLTGAVGAYFGVSPAMTGILSGAATYATTGNLSKGLLSGIGAWGSASMTSNVLGAGANELAISRASEAGTLQLDPSLGSYGNNTLRPEQLSQKVASGEIDINAANRYGEGFTKSFDQAKTPSAWEKTTKGFETIQQNPGAFFKQNMFPMVATAAPLLMPEDKKPSTPDAGAPAQIRPYTYAQERNPDFGIVPGAPYFKQSYTAGAPYTAKEGGIVALASGGPVERMSQMNTAMNPQGGLYPQGMIDMTQYATPSQRPVSSELVSAVPAYERSDPMLMADGGAAKAPQVGVVPLAPATNRYTMPQNVPSQAVQDYNQLIASRAANEYVTQPTPLSLLPGGGERASATDTSKIINEYYLKNLGRQADQPGLEYWTKQKTDTGMSLADINKAIATSGEANIRNFYKQNYDRYATPEEITGIQQRYAAGETPQQIIASLQKNTPRYKEWESAPITQANFDAAAYLKVNPDIARFSEYAQNPFLHYERYGKAEGREAPRTPFQATSPAPKAAAQTGYSYDPITKTYTEPTTETVATDPLQDPAFLEWQKQDQLRRWQQSQQVDGGKAGGLMPSALRSGGISDLGDYSDGGRLLKGPGDGVSDSIPAQIGARQPARLADGEFVVPARIVSELGNGSTDAGARKLYAMMDRIQKKRSKSVGKNKVAVDSKAESALPV